MRAYFPDAVNGRPIEAFLLDGSFYKPRDIVWRLSLAQKLFGEEPRFTQRILNETEMEYSGKLWDEVRYELSAIYSDEEINSIEGVLSGGSAAFDYQQIEQRYRLGAIGNFFRSGNENRNRWAFRGDPTLLLEKRMEIHKALLKRLSATRARS